MAGQKRALDPESSTRKSKKSKTEASHGAGGVAPQKSSLVSEEIDFPRGGGTSFTPLEVKGIRAEAVKEANAELFKDSQSANKSSKKRKRKEAEPSAEEQKLRIEHLNYKRMHTGMKIFGQIVAIESLALVVSLPNQLFGHVPMTNISSQFSNKLEKLDDEKDSADGEEEETEEASTDLADLFEVGQYVRATVIDVHASNTTDVLGLSKSRDDVVRASRRVELSVSPDKVNAGVQKADLKTGFTITCSVKSIEDHGYELDLGVSGTSGFLPTKDIRTFSLASTPRIGQLLDVTIQKAAKNGRIFEVTADSDTFQKSALTEVTNVASVLPGSLVQCLVTDVRPSGVNVQVLGFFDGTIESLHLSSRALNVGKKVKARVLYDIPASPPRYALTLLGHVVHLTPQQVGDDQSSLQDIYPTGTILDEVTVVRVDAERGLVVKVDDEVQGFVHISHVSDDHVPTLTMSGPWKPGSICRARVLGYFAFDGILQLTFKQSLLEQKFMQVQDVQVGEIVKGTIKSLTSTGLFVSLSGNIDGVIWPNHYADIALKHPAKRFKVGTSIKCRVLAVDTERKRISLTSKKSLLDTQLPLITSFEDAKVDLVTSGVVFRVFDKHIIVEFFGSIRAIVPLKEVSESPLPDVPGAFPLGKVVKVRITSVDSQQQRIVASIRRAAANFKTFNSDMTGVDVGNVVEGVIYEIHKDNAVLNLVPSNVRALISLNNLANTRNTTIATLRISIKGGEVLQDLIVVTRNVEKGFVIVANKPKGKENGDSSRSHLILDTVTTGQIVSGRVTRQTPAGAFVKLSSHIRGIVHATDLSDNFDTGAALPRVDSVVKAAVVDIDRNAKQLTLSTRQSDMHPGSAAPVDRAIASVGDLSVGSTVRGFVKTVMEHGVFVTVGRGIDARVQIRELFDDYVKEWKGRFQPGQLVSGRILSADAETKKVEMTLRSGDLNKTRSSVLKISDLAVGQKVSGKITKVEDFGLFIQIEGSKISGLCHKSELSDNPDADVAVALQGFRPDDTVKAMIVKVDGRRLSLSVKPSHFDEADFEVEEEEAASPEEEAAHSVPEESPTEGDVDMDGPESDEEDGEEEVQIDIAAPTVSFAPAAFGVKSVTSSVIPALKLTSGFQWSADADDGDSDRPSEQSDDETEELSRKKKKRKKEIEYDHTGNLDTKTPESNADFERLLLGSPNSSYLWIRYMSFQLQLSEIDKAREVARRALETIHFREEQEKLNVWTALLNLECVYGTDETLEARFREAASANDSKTIHLRLASILDQAEKHQKAEEQYKRTAKKFGNSSKVWVRYSEHYLQQGNLEESRKLLARSLQSLENRKHLKTISSFAQLEYKMGEAERGKTLFEGIIDSHPKRWDMWSVYMDMEATQSDIQNLRNLFDRVLSLKMTSHKAKAFFKKWLELEKRLGDDEGVEHVKQKAIEWTQRVPAVSS